MNDKEIIENLEKIVLAESNEAPKIYEAINETIKRLKESMKMSVTDTAEMIRQQLHEALTHEHDLGYRQAVEKMQKEVDELPYYFVKDIEGRTLKTVSQERLAHILESMRL